jgi:transcriptional regulator with XRE-family HTH domain
MNDTTCEWVVEAERGTAEVASGLARQNRGANSLDHGSSEAMHGSAQRNRGATALRSPVDSGNCAVNLRRLMARLGLTIDQVVERSGLDPRTIRGILHCGDLRPHARTLHKLAAGLGVPTDELFQRPEQLVHRTFDRRTNPLVDEAVADHPELFAGWGEADFDELYSRFGAGGALTRTGALAAAEAMNRNRDVQRKVALLLESGQADLLCELVEALYRRIAIRTEDKP